MYFRKTTDISDELSKRASLGDDEFSMIFEGKFSNKNGKGKKILMNNFLEEKIPDNSEIILTEEVNVFKD